MIAEYYSAATVLGVLGGYLIARFVPDETGWYPKWFLGFGVAGIVATFGVAVWLSLANPLFMAHILGMGLAIWLLQRASSWQFFLVFALELLFVPGTLVAQLTLVTFIPATGWLYSQNQRKELLWCLLIPTVIIVGKLLL